MMKIGGLQKVSGIDYPGKLSAVVFTQGCNFRCHFCHNPHLVLPDKFLKTIPEEEIFEFLKNRKNKLEAVVVSGGEPTIHQDLPEFLEKIKGIGFLTKLDTNGTNPEMVESLLSHNLLDFIAMDVKHKFDKYNEIAGQSVAVDKIEKSIELIKGCSIEYEFRTTIVPQFHTIDDIQAIAKQLTGAKRFIIQEFVPEHAINKGLKNTDSVFSLANGDILQKILTSCKPYVKEVGFRRA